MSPKTKSRWTPNCTISVALGSAVYMLGGVFVVEDPKKKKRWVYSRDDFRFDTDRPRAGWTPCPDMLKGRYQGKAVAVEGKIYVFGGNDIEHAPHPWGEVFDSIKNEWEPLKPPPKGSYLDKNANIYSPPVSCGGPREEKKIVFAETRFIYHVSSQTWEELPSPKHCLFGGLTSNLVGVGDKLYWTFGRSLYILDMKTDELDGTSIKGYAIKQCLDCHEDEPHLIHMGGAEFCLVTLRSLRRDEDDPHPYGTKVRCTKFRVSDEGFDAAVVHVS